MAGRIRAATPIGSCPDCLSWGASYGSQSYCRACYDFTRRYGRGQCAGCRRVIAVKKGHCRLCWLQAGIAAAGRRRSSPEDFATAGYWQLSLAGMSRLGGTGPARQAPPDGPAPPSARVRLDPAAAERTRRIAALRQAPLGRLGDHRPGPGAGQAHRRRPSRGPRLERPDHHRDQPCAGRRARRPPARRHDRLVPAPGGPAPPGPQHHPHRRDPRPRRAPGRRPDPVLHLPGAGKARACCPRRWPPSVRDWLRTRSQGGPRSRPRDEHTVRMNLNRVHPLLLAWAGHYIHLREVTTADVIAATGLLPASRRRQTLTALRSLFGHARRPARSSATPPAASATASVP